MTDSLTADERERERRRAGGAQIMAGWAADEAKEHARVHEWACSEEGANELKNLRAEVSQAQWSLDVAVRHLTTKTGLLHRTLATVEAARVHQAAMPHGVPLTKAQVGRLRANVAHVESVAGFTQLVRAVEAFYKIGVKP